jgi:hypothetical protein
LREKEPSCGNLVASLREKEPSCGNLVASLREKEPAQNWWLVPSCGKFCLKSSHLVQNVALIAKDWWLVPQKCGIVWQGISLNEHDFIKRQA